MKQEILSRRVQTYHQRFGFGRNHVGKSKGANSGSCPSVSQIKLRWWEN